MAYMYNVTYLYRGETALESKNKPLGYDLNVRLPKAPDGNQVAIARNINWDGHVNYGYDGIWHINAPPEWRKDPARKYVSPVVRTPYGVHKVTDV